MKVKIQWLEPPCVNYGYSTINLNARRGRTHPHIALTQMSTIIVQCFLQFQYIASQKYVQRMIFLELPIIVNCCHGGSMRTRPPTSTSSSAATLELKITSTLFTLDESDGSAIHAKAAWMISHLQVVSRPSKDFLRIRTCTRHEVWELENYDSTPMIVPPIGALF